MSRVDRLKISYYIYGEMGKGLKSDNPSYFSKLSKRLANEIKRIKMGQAPKYKYITYFFQANRDIVKDGWKILEKISGNLERISKKQLEGQPLSEDDLKILRRYGFDLDKVFCYNQAISARDDAPKIVDVFSDSVTKRYTQAGIARPRLIYVLYPYKGREVFCVGAILPYHEFINNKRLTDEEWRHLLSTDKRPPMPKWMKSILSKEKLRNLGTFH